MPRPMETHAEGLNQIPTSGPVAKIGAPKNTETSGSYNLVVRAQDKEHPGDYGLEDPLAYAGFGAPNRG